MLTMMGPSASGSVMICLSFLCADELAQFVLGRVVIDVSGFEVPLPRFRARLFAIFFLR
jgi:hypothetical protein